VAKINIVCVKVKVVLAPRTALRAAARAVQIFAVFIFEYGVSI